MTLTFLPPPADDDLTLAILLYGPPGVGKTTGACSAPGPILLLNAEGQRRSRFARAKYGDKIREVAVTGSKTLDDAALYIRDHEGGEKTVVIDSAGELYRVLVDEAAGHRLPQIQHYQEAGIRIMRFVRGLKDHKLNVVIVAHEELVETADGNTLMPICGGPSLRPLMCAAMDVVAYCGVKKGKDGGREFVAQVVPGSGRYAKDSNGGLGDVATLDLSEWITLKAAALAQVKEG